ncbi:hypothetical protein BDR07DRAFT_1378828 [Suillus spraguei]|nr:hypothetical protein BDR07DRAFT_1378828 [Suillus spraguei]
MSKPQSKVTRVTSYVAVVTDEDVDMSCAANIKQQTDVTAVMPSEPINQPAAIALANDFPPEHWQEDMDPIIIPPPPPPALSVAEPTIHNCLVSLMAQVVAMQMANHNTLTRVDAMEHDFNAHISSMQAKFSAMQLDFSGMGDIGQ